MHVIKLRCFYPLTFSPTFLYHERKLQLLSLLNISFNITCLQLLHSKTLPVDNKLTKKHETREVVRLYCKAVAYTEYNVQLV